MMRGLLDLLFPRGCAACGLRPSPGPFCGACAARLEVLPSWRCTACAGPLPPPEGTMPLERNRNPRPGVCADCREAGPLLVRAAFVHGGAAAEAIHRLKYQGRREVARTLAPLLASAAFADRRRCDAVAPIPLHASRRRERGYDQAMLLAAALAPLVGAPMRRDLLLRLRATDRQVGLDRAQRLRNVAGAFSAAPAAAGLRIVLVDDVVTTGATARAASRALLDAGAREVRVIAFARAGH